MLLEWELEKQINSDGGLVTRNPETIVDLARRPDSFTR